MSDKKASDLLFELQKEVYHLQKLSEDNNQLLKIILNKLNLKEKKEEFDFPPAHVSVPEEKPIVQTPSGDNKHSTIEQTLVYKNSQRPITLAEIKIFDLKTNSNVVKTVTSTSGKWSATLPKGNYRVEIKKGPIQTEKAFIDRFDLEIDGSGKPILLEKKII